MAERLNVQEEQLGVEDWMKGREVNELKAECVVCHQRKDENKMTLDSDLHVRGGQGH